MVLLSLFGFFTAFVMAFFFVHLAREHPKQYGQAKPQRFHVGDTPRIGGLAVLIGLGSSMATAVLGGRLGFQPNVNFTWSLVADLLLVFLPVVLIGAYEDLTQRVSVSYRLLFTSVSAFLACSVLHLSVSRLGLGWLDASWAALPWAGVALAFLAVSGLPHAFNIIDGYNGLAGAVVLMMSLALAVVCIKVGDRQLAGVTMCLAGATAGFLVWNFPRGLIFAGDSGAYLWGVTLSVVGITLVQRHPQVSPWFPLLLLIYPVWETLFSVYRRVIRGESPGVADALHFHQLVYRRIVRVAFDDNHARRILTRNNRTSPYLWSLALFSVIPAVLFWDHTAILMMFTMLFVLSYVVAYLVIIRFKVPSWLRR